MSDPADHLETTLKRRSNDPRNTNVVDTRFGLPPDLMRKARGRVRLVALLVLIAIIADPLLGLLEVLLSSPTTTERPPLLWQVVVGDTIALLAALSLYLAARSERVATTTVLRAGLGFEIVMAFVISLINPLTAYLNTGTLPQMTWATPLIILFPLIVPCPPRVALITAVSAAAMAPLALFILHASGAVVAAPGNFIDAISSTGFAVVFATFGSRVVHGLGLEVVNARRLGSYVLERPLGAGGMGEVWRARHRLLARPAAVKLIRPEVLAGAGQDADVVLRRFEREAQATAGLRSPHTIDLYDFGIADDGTFYYVMELLDGFDTETLVARHGPLEPERCVHVLRQVCTSLAEAHDAGLIHRDIKPANVYVCTYGRELDFVKVLDFGLVKPTAEAEDAGAVKLTGTNVAQGTPAYMAPEQILGGTLDARTDLYGVGCLGYWLLTGQLVFDARSAIQLLSDHAHTTPQPPSARTELAIPEALDRLILWCLQKAPDGRPPHADAVIAALDACPLDRQWDHQRAARWWSAHHRPDDGAIATPS